VDVVDLTCELGQVAYIAITGLILAKERTTKVAERTAKVGRINN
jgi:hypothetical protein